MTSSLSHSLWVVGAAWIGASVPFFVKPVPAAAVRPFVSFGAGVLLGASLLHMLPEAVQYLGAEVGVWVLVGFLSLYLLESFSLSHACEEGECDVHHLGWIAAGGLIVHNLVNGLALGFGGRAPEIDADVFLATLAHKAPEFLALSGLLLGGGHSRPRTALLVGAVSIAVPAGVLAAEGLLSGRDLSWLGRALAFAAGTFLHLSASDMTPQAHRLRRFRSLPLVCFLGGLGVMGVSRHLEGSP